MSNVMAALLKIGGPPLLNAAKFGWRLLLKCCAIMLPIQENARLECKVNFALGRIPWRGKSSQKCIYSVPAQEMAKHHVKFGWLPFRNIGAVTKPRHETRWNLLGCPKLQNRSQPLVGRSSPYCENKWRRYYCLTSFFPIVDTCLSCEDTARQSCVMVGRLRIFGNFLHLVFSASHVQRISDLHSKFALRSHRVKVR